MMALLVYIIYTETRLADFDKDLLNWIVFNKISLLIYKLV